MLEGQTETPVAARDLPAQTARGKSRENSTPLNPDKLRAIHDQKMTAREATGDSTEISTNSTPLGPDALKAIDESMRMAASDVTGGATEEGIKRVEYKIQLYRFLKEKVGLDPKQYQDLPEELRKAIDGFDPKDEKELDTQFADILEKLNASGKLSNEQQETVGQLKKAIVDDGILKAEIVFEALRNKVDEANISREEKAQAINELNGLQEDLKKPDIEARTKSFPERIPKAIRIVGLGGVAVLLLSLWRGLKEMMGRRQV